MAALKLAIQGLEPALSVRRFDVRERLSDLFTVSIVAVSPSPDLDPDEVVFGPASFSILAGWAYVRSGGRRHLTGLCESIRQIQAEPSGLSTYSLKIVPHLWLATQRRNYRIFQNANIPDILTQILEEFSITHEWRIGHDDFPRLNYIRFSMARVTSRSSVACARRRASHSILKTARLAAPFSY